MHPGMTSQGVGTALLRQVVDLGCSTFDPSTIRTVVAVFNERSLASCARAGFLYVRDFPGPGGRHFRELALQLPLDRIDTPTTAHRPIADRSAVATQEGVEQLVSCSRFAPSSTGMIR